MKRHHRSLVKAIENSSVNPIISELKFASPSLGQIRDFEAPLEIAEAMVRGGACALSVLTDPDGFQGNLQILSEIAQTMDVPVIMKDIIVSPVQLEAGAQSGADAVVLIAEGFAKNLTKFGLRELIEKAHAFGLEVLVEANDPKQFGNILQQSLDLYGINNRNLSNLSVDLSTTEKILSLYDEIDRPVVSESGIETLSDVRRLKAAGADAFLVGSSIMKASDIEEKVKQLVRA